MNISISNNLDLNSILNFPCTIFMKDRNGIYLGGNNYLASILGFKDGASLVGCNDRDLWQPNDLELLLQNDKKVMDQNSPNTFHESGALPDNSIINAISHKAPLLSHKNKTIGIMGMSIIIHKTNPTFIHNENKFELTNRQINCLYYLALGMTTKLIANKLDLSPRTVEHYIEIIKNKLNCYNRSDLIAKALEMPIIKVKLFNHYFSVLSN